MKRGKKVRALRRAKAEERDAERIKRTPRQQLQRLDEMFGVDQGATKERARLKKKIEGGD